MDLENLWYEASPFVYGIGGLFALLTQPGAILLRISGVLLIAAALTILRMRWRYRRALYRQTADAAGVLRSMPADGTPET